jgi:hypothetical protein
MKLFKLGGGTDWAVDPNWYVTDPAFYADKIAKAREALTTLGADVIEFCFVGEPEGAGFLDIDEDFPEDQTPKLYVYDGDDRSEKIPAYIRDPLSYEPIWAGPHLKVMSDQVYLEWVASKSDEPDTLWFYLESNYMAEGGLMENYP